LNNPKLLPGESDLKNNHGNPPIIPVKFSFDQFQSMRRIPSNYESALKTVFCHFERREKSYNSNKNKSFLVATLLEMTNTDLFRVGTIINL